jgi:hypothetical protein
MSENNNHVNMDTLNHNQNGVTMSDIELSRLSELETVVEAGLQTFYDVGQALIEIRDSRLYRLNYKTWDGYCRDRWGMSFQHAARLIDAAEIVDTLSKSSPELEGFPIPISEWQVRPLVLLDTPEQRREAWHRAIDTAPDGDMNKITHGHVKAIVDDIRGVERPVPTSEPTIDFKSTVEDADDDFNLQSDDVAEPPQQPSDFNYKRDMRSNRKADEYVPQGHDLCQTPPYALAPLLPYLKTNTVIWEPAVGEGNIAMELSDKGFDVEIGDILRGQNFFEYEPDKWDVLVTNPPYSLKYRWLKRCYELGKPFALLLPVETLGAKTAQELMQEYGFEVMLLNRRINFKMPNAGWSGGGSQFATMWFCWQVLPQPIVFGDIQYPSATEESEDDEIY